MKFLKPLAVLLLIPAFGFGVSYWVISDLDAVLKDKGMTTGVQALCAMNTSSSGDIAEACAGLEPVFLMKTGSIVVALASLALMASFTAASIWAGQNRKRIAKVFPALTKLTVALASLLIVAQGSILTYGIYLAESYAIGRVHFVVIGLLALATLAGGISLIKTLFSVGSKQPQHVIAEELRHKDHPKLFSLVSKVANELGSQKPANIIAGLEPNFYVTTSDVALIGQQRVLTGETLYVSLPLVRILDEDELTGIIGHELGHFRGEDTEFSKKFAPAYRNLGLAMQAMVDHQNGQDGPGLVAKPVHVLLTYMIEQFHSNVSSINRLREFEADKAGASVARPEALASSLLKLGLYSHAWNSVQQDLIDRLHSGLATRNASRVFASIVQHNVDESSLPDCVENLVQNRIPHPMDSHPPTAQRLEEMGVDYNILGAELLKAPKHSAVALFGEVDEIERSLTDTLQRYYIAMGVPIPEKPQQHFGATVLAAFGAHMVTADGHVDSREVDLAEGYGNHASASFDYIQFREYCHYPETLPAIEDLVDVVSRLEEGARYQVVDYVTRIASSDGDVCKKEQALLSYITESLCSPPDSPEKDTGSQSILEDTQLQEAI